MSLKTSLNNCMIPFLLSKHLNGHKLFWIKLFPSLKDDTMGRSITGEMSSIISVLQGKGFRVFSS